MTSCSVKWCGNSSRNSNLQKNGITFHRFPKSPETKKIWIDATRRGDNWWPNTNNVICSRHFREEFLYEGKNRRRLLMTAVPTLYLPKLEPSEESREKGLHNQVHETSKDDAEVITPDSHLPISTNRINEKSIRNYDSIEKKRMCLRIIELKNIIQTKNKAISKLTSSNRRMKRKIVSLQSKLDDSETKKRISTEKNCILDLSFNENKPGKIPKTNILHS